LVVFLGIRAIPGDQATAMAGDDATPAVLQAIRHEYLLDKPLPVQYGRWLWLALQGNLGRDHRTGRLIRRGALPRQMACALRMRR
jgi:peptide/nickel transport system permease protein